MKHYDPEKIRPRKDWVIVQDDSRREKTSGGIILPTQETGLEKVTEGAGTIIRVGPGDLNRTLDLAPGLRIVYRSFLKYANDIPVESKNRFFFMSSEDIMAVIAKGVDVGVFSGRPEVPTEDAA